jgi:hypothetical protein
LLCRKIYVTVSDSHTTLRSPFTCNRLTEKSTSP